MTPAISGKILILSLVVAALLVSPGSAEFTWKVASPESQGMSAPLLDALRDSLASRKTTALVVIRHDRIVYEWYAPGQSPTNLNDTGSMAQVLVGGLSLGSCFERRTFSLDDRASKYVGQWQNVADKSRITIRQLSNSSSGIEDAEQAGLNRGQLPGWKGAFWKQLAPPDDPFTLSRDSAPVILAPGTFQTQSKTAMAMLAYAVTASLKGPPQADIRMLLRDRIMRPIGVLDDEWSIGYGRTFEVDGLRLVPNWEAPRIRREHSPGSAD